MKTKTYLIVSIALLLGVSAWADDVWNYKVYDDCSKNGKIEDIRSIGEENGRTWVDLGLPSGIKWATCNVGATTPEDYGDYIAWGEPFRRYSYYWWNDYKYGSYPRELTKYCTDSSFGYHGFLDDKTVLDPEDDPAHRDSDWGGEWRMPTEADWKELIENCTWTWTRQNRVNGYKVASKTNSNSIFLPAAGYYDYNELHDAGSYGCYWSSSLRTSYPANASCLKFTLDDYFCHAESRPSGLSVRPVCP